MFSFAMLSNEIFLFLIHSGFLIIFLWVLESTKNSAGVFPFGANQRRPQHVTTFTPLVCCAEKK